MTKRYDDLPKVLKREIRELAGVVHERLLTAELDAVELAETLHRFREGPPREPWLMFNTNHLPVLRQSK